MTSRPDPEVFLGIASFDSRSELLRGAITSLIDQVDRIGVYLNNYDRVPSFLEHARIEVALSRDHGDLRDNGKFFFLNECQHRFYAAADDDILYPPDYVQRLKSTLAEAGPNAAVGVHGAVYPSRILGLLSPRRLYHYLDPLPHVMPLHLIGTGTLLFEQAKWDLRFDEFGEPGMADVWFALAARRRSARLFAINRGKEWLVDVAADEEPDPVRKGPTLFAEGRADDSMQVKLVSDANISHGGFEGLIETLIESDRFSEEFSISHAAVLNELRGELGWLPIDHDFARTVSARMSATRAGWTVPLCTDDDIAAYTAAVTGVLAVDAAADVVAPVLDALDRLEALSESDGDAWRALPHPLRFDTRSDRLERLRGVLLDLGVRRSSEDARALWPRAALLEDALPVGLAIEVERAGVDTRFQRLPRLKAAGVNNPVEAGLLFLQYFEARNWSVTPDVLAWKRTFGKSFSLKEVQLLLTLTALRTGNPEMATRLVEGMRHRWPGDFDVGMMQTALRSDSATSVFEATLLVIEALDVLLELVGLRPYREFARHEDRALTHWIDVFDPKGTESPGATGADVPEVSVIMTVHNDAGTVGAAMSSVLASRGVAVEFIVVDDASTDGTSKILEQVADSRVKLVRNPENLGPYLSRNRGLELATGEFITIADADDWSHPDRMAYQAARLTIENDLLGCTVAHVRLRPDGNPDLENNLLFLGHGPVSLMFRRSVIDQVGGFDHVRTRGDLEFMRRLRARFGDGALTSFDVPLILATSNPSSNSKRYTAEALGRYRRAARQWHLENAISDALYVDIRGDRAPFIAPQELIAPGQIETSSRS